MLRLAALRRLGNRKACAASRQHTASGIRDPRIPVSRSFQSRIEFETIHRIPDTMQQRSRLMMKV
jgi:hypothetical protein